jgi:hypothetical protein
MTCERMYVSFLNVYMLSIVMLTVVILNVLVLSVRPHHVESVIVIFVLRVFGHLAGVGQLALHTRLKKLNSSIWEMGLPVFFI